MVQDDFSKFAEAPLLLFLCMLRNTTCLIRVLGSDPLFYFYLDFLFPSLLCLFCSISILFSAISPWCGTLSRKGNLVGHFQGFIEDQTAPPLSDLWTTGPLYLLFIGGQNSRFNCCSEIGLPCFLVNICLLLWNSPVCQIFHMAYQLLLLSSTQMPIIC